MRMIAIIHGKKQRKKERKKGRECNVRGGKNFCMPLEIFFLTLYDAKKRKKRARGGGVKEQENEERELEIERQQRGTHERTNERTNESRP